MDKFEKKKHAPFLFPKSLYLITSKTTKDKNSTKNVASIFCRLTHSIYNCIVKAPLNEAELWWRTAPYTPRLIDVEPPSRWNIVNGSTKCNCGYMRQRRGCRSTLTHWNRGKLVAILQKKFWSKVPAKEAWILINNSLNFVTTVQLNNKSALIQEKLTSHYLNQRQLTLLMHTWVSSMIQPFTCWLLLRKRMHGFAFYVIRPHGYVAGCNNPLWYNTGTPDLTGFIPWFLMTWWPQESFSLHCIILTIFFSEHLIAIL